MPIGGKSTVYFMVADPVDHAKSPRMFNTLLATENIYAIMVTLTFPVSIFETSWFSFEQMKNLRGITFSVPFKRLTFAQYQHANLPAGRVSAVIWSLTHILAAELESFGIRVNAPASRYTLSDSWKEKIHLDHYTRVNTKVRRAGAQLRQRPHTDKRGCDA